MPAAFTPLDDIYLLIIYLRHIADAAYCQDPDTPLADDAHFEAFLLPIRASYTP